MEQSRIISILEDWNFWKKDIESGIERKTYLELIERFAKTGEIVIITGARRSGKSYLMRQYAKNLINQGTDPKNILFINFEDPRFGELDAKTLDFIYETYIQYLNPKGKLTILLDEVQEVKEWEKWVRMMHELGKADIIITGSNAKLLSEELATVLTGRHLDITVFPLRFREFLTFKGMTIKDKLDVIAKKTDIKRMLNEYMEHGSYPKVALSREKKDIHLRYYDDLLNRDLIKRYKIKKTVKIKALSSYYISNIACPTTFSSIEKYLEISKDTINKYAGYLENVYLLFFLKRFSFKVRDQEKSPRKVYSIDTGLANTIGFRFSGKKGRLAENIAYLELLMRMREADIYYWKDAQEKEVDFVVWKNNKAEQLIQVSWIREKSHLNKRETDGLIKASRELDCDDLLVITDDYEALLEIGGKNIKFVPLFKWLLL